MMDGPQQLSADVDTGDAQDDFIVIQSSDITPPIDQSLSALSQPDLVATCRKLMEGHQLLGDKLRSCTLDLEMMQNKYKSLLAETQQQCAKARQLVHRLSRENTQLRTGGAAGGAAGGSLPGGQMVSSPAVSEFLQDCSSVNTELGEMTSDAAVSSCSVSSPHMLSSDSENDALRKEIQDLKVKMNNLMDKKRELTKQRDEAVAGQRAAEAILQEVASQKNPQEELLKKELAHKETEVASLKEQLRGKEIELFSLGSQKSQYEAEVSRLRGTVDQTVAECDKAKRAAAEGMRHMKQAQDERRGFEAQLDKQRQELMQCKRQLQEMQPAYRGLEGQVAQLMQKNRELTQQNERLNASNLAAASGGAVYTQATGQPTDVSSEGEAQCFICHMRGTEEYINNHLQREHGI